MMVTKAKDVVRDALMVLAAAPILFHQPRSSTLPSELVPHAGSARAERSRRVHEFSPLFNY
jgi:hypothetical protein